MAGSLLMASAFDRIREGVWLGVSFLGMALAGIVYSFVHSIPLAIMIVTISGFFNAPSAIARRVVVQRNTPRDMRGRVNSVFFVSRDVLFLVGMGMAGLADTIDVRLMFLGSSIILLAGAGLVMALPGLRQEAAEWRLSLGLLRAARSAPGVGSGRAAVPADFDLLVGLVPTLSVLAEKERAAIVKAAKVVEVPAGTAILRRGEAGDTAYFILSGRVAAGLTEEGGDYHSLESMLDGDLFGEIAALTGSTRRADVVATDDSTLFKIPAEVLRSLMSKPALNSMVLSKMTERLSISSPYELPRFAGMDQKTLRELRTAPAEE